MTRRPSGYRVSLFPSVVLVFVLQCPSDALKGEALFDLAIHTCIYLTLITCVDFYLGCIFRNTRFLN